MDKIVITDNYSTSSHIIARRTDREMEINVYDDDINQYCYLVISLAEAKRLRDFLIKALEVNSES